MQVKEIVFSLLMLLPLAATVQAEVANEKKNVIILIADDLLDLGSSSKIGRASCEYSSVEVLPLPSQHFSQVSVGRQNQRAQSLGVFVFRPPGAEG